jgi:D-alanyl-D-alanine carboxypeptidase
MKQRTRHIVVAFAAASVVVFGLAACVATEGGTRMPAGLAGLSSDGDVHTAENGYIAAGESVSSFDEHLPTIARLDPGLRAAVQAAETAAKADGFEFVIASGWRSAAYQQALLDEAVITYGSYDEARKWVNTPELSKHISGEAVDIGYTDANSWMSQHGADYGLCQIYTNEMWHFELATEPGGECPAQLGDSAG